MQKSTTEKFGIAERALYTFAASNRVCHRASVVYVANAIGGISAPVYTTHTYARAIHPAERGFDISCIKIQEN